jgi:hypothetical protein
MPPIQSGEPTPTGATGSSDTPISTTVITSTPTAHSGLDDLRAHMRGNSGAKWDSLRKRANTIGGVSALFLVLIVAGGAGGYFYSQGKKATPAAKAPNIATLSPSELSQLGSIGANLGTTNQVLNIGADALFRGKAAVVGDLTVGGHFSANGPVTLSALSITGSSAVGSLNVGSNLNVTGTSTLQGALTVSSVATINNNLNVSGQISANGITTNSLSVKILSISGPITIAHLATGGPTPFYASGSDGSGGTVNINGNDTSGNLNINTGTGPGAGATLMTVTFRAAYGSTPRVLLSPISSGAASSQAYAIPTSTGFQIRANTPPSGQTLSFDYFVTQ